MTIRAIFVDASGTIIQASQFSQFGLIVSPDARSLLFALKQRSVKGTSVKSGLITNWGSRIYGVVDELALNEHFDTVICALPPLKAKPDPTIFLAACTELGVEPSSCVHIGDSLYDDALGAQGAGLQALWINRGRVKLSDQEVELASQLKHPVFPDLQAAFTYLETMF